MRGRREPACAARALVLVGIVVGGLGSRGISVDLDGPLTSNDSRIGVIRACKLDEATRAARATTSPGKEH